LKRTCLIDDEATSTSGVRIGTEGSAQELMLFASVPVTNEAWQSLSAGEMIAVRHGRHGRQIHLA
jgi:hypothetical protein